MPGGQLQAGRFAKAFDDQPAAVIAVGVGEEERRRQVAPDPEIAAAAHADCIVDMVAEIFAARIAVEIGRIDFVRQRRGNEQWAAAQCIEH